MTEKISTDPVALITGGSAGIGLELSKLFAADNYNLVIVSKPAEELVAAKDTLQSQYPGKEIRTIQKDLSIQGAALDVYNEVKEAGTDVEVLVNNAGFGTWGFMNEIPLEKELSMINLNVVTLYHFTRLFLADMIEKNRGKILNVSSTAGLHPVPHFATYSATKSFSLFLSEALNFELKQSGSAVSVTALCPPPVRTGFQKASGMEKSNLFKKSSTMEAPEVAKAAYEALFQKKSMILPSRSYRMMFKFMKLLSKKAVMKGMLEGMK